MPGKVVAIMNVSVCAEDGAMGTAVGATGTGWEPKCTGWGYG